MPPQRQSRPPSNWLGQTLAGLGAWLRGNAGAPTPAPVGPTSELVAFYCHDGRDHAGRSHAEILAFSDHELERVHDFIQWLFPLPEPSQAFHAAPVLSEADLAVMQASPICQARLDAAQARMTAFLTENPVWLDVFDHNHLRITRMIRSTRLIAGDAAADGLRVALLEHVQAQGAQINANTLAFWASA